MSTFLNTSLYWRTAALVVGIAVVLLLGFVRIATACGPVTAPGCETNCTVQIINDCQGNTECFIMACAQRIGRDKVCGGCIPKNGLGCTGLLPCCSGGH
jgi:hypothetical protein